MKCDHQFVQHCSKCETFIVPESCRLTDAERAVIEAAFKHLIGSSKHPCCELDSATDALRAERAPRFIRPTGTKDDEVWAAAMGVLSEPHSDAPAWRRLVAALEAASERIK